MGIDAKPDSWQIASHWALDDFNSSGGGGGTYYSSVTYGTTYSCMYLWMILGVPTTRLYEDTTKIKRNYSTTHFGTTLALCSDNTVLSCSFS